MFHILCLSLLVKIYCLYLIKHDSTQYNLIIVENEAKNDMLTSENEKPAKKSFSK